MGGALAILLTAAFGSASVLVIHIDVDRYYMIPVVFGVLLASIGIGAAETLTREAWRAAPAITMEEFESRLSRLDDGAWFNLLSLSPRLRTVGGIEFPGFPPDELQLDFVGSSGIQALAEAFVFYRFMKQRAASLGRPIVAATRLLDFGCGWGRFLRFFWKDVGAANLYGCDVDQRIVDVCRSLGVPGRIDLLDARGSLPYPDSHFDAILAYSVFTHLPEGSHLRWLHELARVSRPGCVVCLTVEPRRFLDFVAAVPPDSESDWHVRLSAFASSAADLGARYDRGELVFLPTNPGHEDIYGDAIVPPQFIERHWSHAFDVKEYLDDLWKFRQAVVVLQRR
jgi:SAM-dependent methyltransferase